MRLILWVVAPLLATLFIAGLAGCGGSSDPYAGITPELRLAPVMTDGSAPLFMGMTEEEVQRYDVPVGSTVIVNLVWAPEAPRGVTYQVTHYINGATQQAENRGGPSEIDGSISLTLNDYGYHLIQVKAVRGGEPVGFGQLMLEVGKG